MEEKKTAAGKHRPRNDRFSVSTGPASGRQRAYCQLNIENRADCFLKRARIVCPAVTFVNV